MLHRIMTETMPRKILVAGAGGVVGRRLTPLLQQSGYEIFGTTRSPVRAAELRKSGVRPIVLDVFDQRAVVDAVAEVRPEVVIHQLTDLSGGFAPEQQAETLARNSRIRIEGTQNLVLAARAAGVRRLIAQSIVWVFAPGPEPHGEDDPLDLQAEGTRGTTVQGVAALERTVLGAAPVEGVVLRYGWFYGAGANARPAGQPAVHVDAAAYAAVLAIDRGAPGLYNVAEPSASTSTDKVRRALGWDPSYRLPAAAGG
jgi:nucleoside-diphosphate-sugar epimerase